MRFTQCQYVEKEVVTVSFRNNRASGVILDGQPIFLQSFDAATNFGTDAQLLSDSAAGVTFAAGIAKWSKLAGSSAQIGSAAVGDVGESVVYGFTDAIITLRTRAASTDTWASAVAIVAGDQLVPETVGNNLQRQGTLAASAAALAEYAAAQSVASVATAASNGTLLSASSSALVDTIRMKVFINLM